MIGHNILYESLSFTDIIKCLNKMHDDLNAVMQGAEIYYTTSVR